jgi:hypothetical protein
MEVLLVNIGWFRDLVIILFGIIGMGFLIVLIVMALSLFPRLRVILDSLKVTSTNIEEISSIAKEQIVRPIVQVGSLFQGILKWIEVIGGFLKRNKKEMSDGDEKQ